MILLLALSILSVDTPEPPALGLSLIPPKLKLPARKAPIPCEPDMTTFAPYPTPGINGEMTVVVQVETKDHPAIKWVLRPGLLVSECEFTKILNMQSEHESMASELAIINTLDDTRTGLWRDGEQTYQKRIVALEEDLKEAREVGFWEMWKGPILFGLGILVATLTFVAATELLKVQAKWNAASTSQ